LLSSAAGADTHGTASDNSGSANAQTRECGGLLAGAGGGDGHEGVPDAVFVDVNCELNRYLNELKDITPLNVENGLQFWLDRESTYLRLSQLAEDLVCSPASQAYVERLFSLCRELTAGKRNCCRLLLCRRAFLMLNRRVLLQQTHLECFNVVNGT
jgi:hypothetical protein